MNPGAYVIAHAALQTAINGWITKSLAPAAVNKLTRRAAVAMDLDPKNHRFKVNSFDTLEEGHAKLAAMQIALLSAYERSPL